MENRLKILDIEIETLTAKDTLKKIVQFMEDETLHTAEIMTLELLMQGQENAEWKEQIRTMDLVLPGEREILEASGTPENFTDAEIGRLMRELDQKVFIKILIKYLQRSRKTVFLLAGQEQDLLLLQNILYNYAKGISLAGQAVFAEGSGKEENIINEINGVEPDCILSVLPYPVQENFIYHARALLNARVWVGCGMPLLKKEQKTRKRLRRFVLKKALCYLVGRENREK